MEKRPTDRSFWIFLLLLVAIAAGGIGIAAVLEYAEKRPPRGSPAAAAVHPVPEHVTVQRDAEPLPEH